MQKSKKYIVAIILMIYLLDIWATTKMRGSNRNDNILKSSNPLQKALDWAKYALYQESNIGVHYVWGIESSLLLDPSQSKWKMQNRG